MTQNEVASMLQQILAQTKGQNKAISSLAQDAVMRDKVEGFAEKPQKTGVLSKLAAGAASLLDSPIGDSLASMIPGGAIAKNLAGSALKLITGNGSTNDDEWFEEFSSAGATFNEPFGLIQYPGATSGVTDVYNLTGCLLEITVDLPISDYWKRQLLPTILAYVRSKTNNVLNATEDDYWKAFTLVVRLYAYYYQGLKYIELAEHIPTNISGITTVFPTIQPATISQFKGVIENLGDFLKSTCKLPYALTSYIRWRFGKTFNAVDSSKPGLVMYNFFDSNESVDEWILDIEELKAQLITVSRANSDIALAYANHVVSYSVDPRAYDKKEFLLRCNLQSAQTGIATTTSNVLLYLDERLNASTVLQASTLSTGVINVSDTEAVAPFPIKQVFVHLYLPKSIKSYFEYQSGDQYEFTVPAGWHSAVIDLKSNDTSKLKVIGTAGGYSAEATVSDAVKAVGTTSTDAAIKFFVNKLADIAVNSLELHNYARGWCPVNKNGGITSAIRARALACDTAYVTAQTITGMQKTALRNLIRGNYSNATPKNQRASVMEAQHDMVEVITK